MSLPAETDALQDTLDYSRVYHGVVELAERSRFHLLERLADAIAGWILKMPRVTEVRIVLKKTEILGMESLGYAAVEMVRRRAHASGE